jgi:hypothetical protein
MTVKRRGGSGGILHPCRRRGKDEEQGYTSMKKGMEKGKGMEVLRG